MRVLLDAIQVGNMSGTGSYTAALVRELPRLENSPELFVVWPRQVPWEETGLTADSVLLCDTQRRFAGTMHRNLQMGRHIGRLKPDIVHYPANIGRLLGHRGASKTVLTVHDLSFLRNPKWFRRERAAYYRRAIRRSVARSDKILADSFATADDLVELLGVDAGRIEVTHLGVDERFRPASTEAIEAASERYGLPERFFLYLGTLEPRKNLPRLIAAWDRIHADCEIDLVVAGRDGWKYKDIYRAARRAKHRSRIFFPGFIDSEDLPAVLSAAHAFVWPSLWEGFGLPPLEAMACGTPVLTSNTSSLPEVAQDAAVLVDPLNSDEIENGMRRLATDDQLRAMLENNGLNRAEHFTWRRTAELTHAVYESLTG